MRTRALLDSIPGPALAYGLAGLLPFAASAISAFMPGLPAAVGPTALLAYGAVILSFLGGIQWGLAMAQDEPSYVRLGSSVLPSLLAWAALLVDGDPGLVLLALSFAGILLFDLHLTRGGMAPAWYPQLRIPLTVAVILCLVIGIAG